ncbi:hypothetical protein Hanom_Chr14g01298751 [Helianthus anomalus]
MAPRARVMTPEHTAAAPIITRGFFNAFNPARVKVRIFLTVFFWNVAFYRLNIDFFI